MWNKNPILKSKEYEIDSMRNKLSSLLLKHQNDNSKLSYALSTEKNKNKQLSMEIARLSKIYENLEQNLKSIKRSTLELSLIKADSNPQLIWNIEENMVDLSYISQKLNSFSTKLLQFQYRHSNDFLKIPNKTLYLQTCKKYKKYLQYLPHNYINSLFAAAENKFAEGNYVCALKYFEYCAVCNFAPSFDKIASILLNGLGIDKTPRSARYWRHAKSHDPEAYYQIGNMYFRGPLNQNMKFALFWYQKAANYGEPKSMQKIAWIYGYGLGGVIKSKAVAKSWYKKSIMLENAEKP
eukprot:NODE_140_length_16098_cov_0.678605.p9 type:complete len:295 gc:universal NODE_140_length_16098_cov_0.678605:7105-6221(-)